MRLGAVRRCGTRRIALSSVLIVMAIVLSGCLGSQTAGPGPAPAGMDPHEWTAEQLASRILSSFAPPPSAVRLSRAPNASIGGPWSTPGSMELIDHDRIWRADGNMTTVQSWIDDHVRPDWTIGGSGTTGQYGPKPPGNIGNEVGTFVTFETPSKRTAVVSSEALFSVVPDGVHHVFIRIDVQVIWQPTRPLWSYVPTGEQKVTVTSWASGRPRVTSSTQPSVVASVRSAVNAMTITTWIPHTCLPSALHYSVRLSGLAASDVVITTGGCLTTLQVSSHPAFEVSDNGGRLLAAVGRIS